MFNTFQMAALVMIFIKMKKKCQGQYFALHKNMYQSKCAYKVSQLKSV